MISSDDEDYPVIPVNPNSNAPNQPDQQQAQAGPFGGRSLPNLADCGGKTT